LPIEDDINGISKYFQESGREAPPPDLLNAFRQLEPQQKSLLLKTLAHRYPLRREYRSVEDYNQRPSPAETEATNWLGSLPGPQLERPSWPTRYMDWMGVPSGPQNLLRNVATFSGAEDIYNLARKTGQAYGDKPPGFGEYLRTVGWAGAAALPFGAAVKAGKPAFKRMAAGDYEAKIADGGVWTISKNEGVSEWSVRENGNWHEYFPTLQAAKNYVDGVAGKAAKSTADKFFGPKGRSTQLSPEALKAFKTVSSTQRGAPEIAMLNVQGSRVAPELDNVVEHIGDLTHVLTNEAERGSFRRARVRSKIEGKVQILEDPNLEAFIERNHERLARYNRETKGVSESVDTIRERYHQLMKQYADEHRKIPVFNRPQKLARDAAVAVGERQFKKAAELLRALDKIAEDSTGFQHAASIFRKSRSTGKGGMAGKAAKPKADATGTYRTPKRKTRSNRQNFDAELYGDEYEEVAGDWGLPLNTRLTDRQVRLVLEEHGFSYELVHNGIRAYDGKIQKTFRNPTVKQIRNWLGY
jgi:hypothetical protein